MNVNIAVIFCLGLAAYTSAFPALSNETELIDTKYGDQPIIDTGVVGGAGGFFDSPFDIFQSMESMMRRMREQLGGLLNHFGTSNNTFAGGHDISAFGFPAIPDLDLGKGNTTSVTKIINGQKVVINETKYGKETENGGAFFKVRVIEVKPEKPDQEEATTASATRDVESIENSQENEIPKRADNEAQFGKLEPLDDFDYTLRRKVTPSFNQWGNLEDFDAENRIDGPIARPMKPYDLSNDIYVNKLLADKGYPMNPDAEFIGRRNNVQNFKHDLSRDIWVNQMMADQGVTPDPDSESIFRNPRKFEKYIIPR
ncbi:hypothetical protein WA026_009442 [Henosepilachna vigintioctopunctata]|uniref:Uncharacterized protein n=1 Tax=Henosepilachna vigintioctopunctata TaxID=420089 RepID=A0AAW1U4Q6_9CUCU